MDAETDLPAPNHHAHYPGLSGVGGVVAALSMAFGRGEMAAAARDLVDLRPGDRLVDVGCGPGAAARAAAAFGAQVTGVDPLPVMLRTARLLDPRRRAEWRRGVAEDLPLPSASADAAWTLASVHHWPDVPRGIAEVHRVLVGGGRFVAIERRIDDTGAAGLASHGWTRAQAASFAAMCEAAGFVDVEVGERAVGSNHHLAVVARSAMIGG